MGHYTMNASRRAFLRKASSLSLAGAAAPWALNLAALGEAAAQSATDYKALVCVFLYGGNDYANTLVPYDTVHHEQYRVQRAALAHSRTTLGATVLDTMQPALDRYGVPYQYALAPDLFPLMPLWKAGRLATLLNVGTLVQPTTKDQYRARSVPLPPKLFSHNDQQSVWQASAAEGATTGWGGRMGDLFEAANERSTFTCVNVSGNAVFMSGRRAVQYQVTSTGSVALNGVRSPLFGSAAASEALRSLVTAQRPHLMQAEHARTAARAIDAHETLTAALATGPTLATAFPTGNTLADQLRMVARMIGSAGALGARRQVFFVSLGGFDNHDALMTTHTQLLGRVGSALAAFQDALTELRVADRVTTFTASDFGRTLTGNNDGSDHGWGSVQFVLGGAVAGGRHYGVAPVIANNGVDDVGQGRLLPTMAVDQMAATQGSWFGLSASQLLDVLPNLRNFDASARQLAFV